jgi:hypothetical protein
MSSLIIAAVVFVAVSLAAGVIAWVARPRPGSLFVEFGGVPARPGLFTHGGASGIGDLADPSGG